MTFCPNSKKQEHKHNLPFLGELKMPKCPKCGEEISTLINYSKATIRYIFDGDRYEEDKIIPSNENDANLFACPECDSILFTTEDEAKEFLQA